MSKAVLVTGQPGCGKTVLVRDLYEHARRRFPTLVYSGFYTAEALCGHPSKAFRVGFDIVTVPGGASGVLARKGLKSKFKTGEYGVDVASFDDLAMPELEVPSGTGLHVVVIDEIGRMEAHSKLFGPAVQKLLEQPNVLLVGSVAAPRYGHKLQLAEDIKAQLGIFVVPMKKSTRQEAKRNAMKALDCMLESALQQHSSEAGGSKKRKRA